GNAMEYKATNLLLRNNNDNWTIYLSKTGYINEAGRCLVMRAKTAGKTVTIVLLNAFGKLTPYGDSNRIRKWLMRNDTELAWLH
ncbi:MAG: peptidase S11, partial [Pseudomonadota bacterium]